MNLFKAPISPLASSFMKIVRWSSVFTQMKMFFYLLTKTARLFGQSSVTLPNSRNLDSYFLYYNNIVNNCIKIIE